MILSKNNHSEIDMNLYQSVTFLIENLQYGWVGLNPGLKIKIKRAYAKIIPTPNQVVMRIVLTLKQFIFD